MKTLEIEAVTFSKLSLIDYIVLRLSYSPVSLSKIFVYLKYSYYLSGSDALSTVDISWLVPTIDKLCNRGYLKEVGGEYQIAEKGFDAVAFIQLINSQIDDVAVFLTSSISEELRYSLDFKFLSVKALDETYC